MTSALDALTRLHEGNQRFAAGTLKLGASTNSERRLELAEGQDPFAIILGCSDSRVPAEIVFDQGLGKTSDTVVPFSQLHPSVG
jgi:carbonic anhydrase